MTEKEELRGGVVILAKNTTPAQGLTVSTNIQADIHGVNILVNDKQHKIFNIYNHRLTYCV